VLNSPEPDRRKLQESLRTLDKYSGPIDGNLQSEATTKGISDWQKGHGLAATGKLTPSEAIALNNEATKAPIRRLDPSAQVASAPAAPPSNADALKSLRARLAERRKAAEPKADAAAQSLVADLKAYVAADGKGPAGEQFAAFAKWYADTKAAGRTVGDIKPAVEDYGDAKAGAAATAEVSFETKQGDKSTSQCMVFAWVEASPRKNTQAFSCDDVAAVEKWKTDQALRSAWR
jgi:peptidoglycan hydrolase-like protein with peptidoglycan-binding domain